MRVLIGVIVTLVTALSNQEATANVVFCYYPQWAIYRPDKCGLDALKSVSKLCTHIGYSFSGVDANGQITSLDNNADFVRGTLTNFKSIKQSNPSVKLIAVIGGAGTSGTFAGIAASSTLRTTFANNVKAFAIKYGFDGVDIDWEFPGPADKQNFNALLATCYKTLHSAGLLLTAAVGPTKTHTDNSYDIAGLHPYLDLINVMTYDMFGTWNHVAENHAAFDGPPGADSAKASIENWVSQGAPKSKLVIGVAAYGRSFTLSSSSSTPGSPISDVGPKGPITDTPGILGYQEICKDILTGSLKPARDNVQKGPYATDGTTWVGFDDDQSIKVKADYVKQQGLAGMLIWSLENDDCSGTCGTKFPLLNSVNKYYGGSASSSPVASPEASPESKPAPESSEQAPQQEPEQAPAQAPEQAPQQAPGSFSCPGDGFFSDPSNQHNYYQCSGGQYWNMPCGAGLRFNPAGYCDF